MSNNRYSEFTQERFSFRVTVVVGNNHGSVGVGIGKANAVPDAIRKATERARKNMHEVSFYKSTIPHEVIGKVGGARSFIEARIAWNWSNRRWWCARCARSSRGFRYFN